MFRSQWFTRRIAVSLIVGLGTLSALLSRWGTTVEIARASSLQKSESAPFTPSDQYETRRIQEWTVHVNAKLLKDQPLLAEQALTLLQFQLYQMTRILPAAPLRQLRDVRFWVEETESHNPCMTYHPSEQWLREHNMNPEKAGCVEVSNVRNFLAWTLDQPWMVLHELSHAYHHQFLRGGFKNQEVLEAFQRAMKAKLYDSVLRINGNRERAYAATNEKEFFAEESEAFFGTNDFYPFVNSELKQHDPKTFGLLQEIWGRP